MVKGDGVPQLLSNSSAIRHGREYSVRFGSVRFGSPGFILQLHLFKVNCHCVVHYACMNGHYNRDA